VIEDGGELSGARTLVGGPTVNFCGGGIVGRRSIIGVLLGVAELLAITMAVPLAATPQP